MKKILLIAAAAFAMSASSYGASLTVICGGATYNSAGTITQGSATAVCPNFTIPTNNQLTNVTLSYFVDYSFAGVGTPTNTISVNFDPSPNGLFSNDTITVTQTGNGSSPGANSATGVQNLLLQAPATYTGATVTLSLININLASAFGQVSGTASVFATYTYDVIPSGVPEPTSVALIGAGLVGIAAVARRRR